MDRQNISKALIICGGIVSIYLLFREQLIAYYVCTDFYSWWLSIDQDRLAILFSIWSLGLVVYYVAKLNARRLSSNNWMVFVALAVLLVSIERFYFEYWDYYPLIHSMKYVDIIFIVASLEALNYYFFWQTRLQLSNDSFIKLERPLKDAKLDGLNRDGFAKMISDQLNKSHFPESLSIAVVGEWSSGKSTLLNFIKNNLHKDSKIVIDFKPWLNYESGTVIKAFFELLKNELSSYDKNLRDQFERYHESIAKEKSGLLVDLLIRLNPFRKEPSMDTEYSEINRRLEVIGKQLVVFIDDLDRLDSREILDVFKLIRNTANFYNTVYITAFDRSPVINAIATNNDFNPHRYIDKIFDLEYVLPEINKNRVVEELNANLKDELDTNFEIKNGSDTEAVTHLMIQNYRDLHRFKILLKMNYSSVYKELVSEEIFILELLRFRYPQIVSHFYRFKERYLTYHPVMLSKDLSLRREKKLQGPNGQLEDVPDLLFHLNANEEHHSSRFHLSKSDIDNIVQVFSVLFESRGSNVLIDTTDKGKPIYNSIRRVDWLPIYFELVFGPEHVKNAEFDKILNGDQGEVINFVDDTLKKPSGSKPAFIFDYIRSILDTKLSSAKIHRNLIIFLLRIESNGLAIPLDLFFALFDRKNAFIRNLFDSDDQLRIVFKELMADRRFKSVSRSRIVSRLVYQYLNEDEFTFLLPIETLEQINLKLFQEYLSEIDKIDNKTLDFYYDQYHTIDPESRAVTLNPIASRLFRWAIRKCPDGYFDNSVRHAMHPNYENRFVFEPFYKQIFGSPTNFEKFLMEHKEYARVEVLIEYWNKFKANKYKDFKLEEEELKKIPDEFINMHTKYFA